METKFKHSSQIHREFLKLIQASTSPSAYIAREERVYLPLEMSRAPLILEHLHSAMQVGTS